MTVGADRRSTSFAAVVVAALFTFPCAAKRLVIVDSEGDGPGGTHMMAMMVMLQSPDVDVLGITIVTGDAWRDKGVQHTLRMLELVGRTDVPVIPGAVFPLLRTQQETMLAARLFGKPLWIGAWGGLTANLGAPPGAIETPPPVHGPWEIPPLREGRPTATPLKEDAPHFLIRQVHAHPGEVTIYAGGPLTNIALAASIDSQFAALTKGIVLMGSSLNPQTDDPEFATAPRHEFNFWFDPEAAHIVLRAEWPRIDVTTVDVSIKTMFTQAMFDAISRSKNPAAQYIAKFTQNRYYMWCELAACAWLDPKLVTKERLVYMDVDINHGPGYGDTLTWHEKLKPDLPVKVVHAQVDLDLPRFTRTFVELMCAPAADPK